MTAIKDSGKRSREDDNCDFMPLSKRINNLHINTMAIPLQGEEHHHITLGETYREAATLPEEAQTPYNPGINSTQSSYYFDNKLLFELYLERLQRSGQQSPY